MREISVTYLINDEEEQRLKQITEEYKKQYNFEMIEDKMFDAIMRLGSYHDIDKKFKFYEWKLGLIED